MIPERDPGTIRWDRRPRSLAELARDKRPRRHPVGQRSLVEMADKRKRLKKIWILDICGLDSGGILGIAV